MYMWTIYTLGKLNTEEMEGKIRFGWTHRYLEILSGQVTGAPAQVSVDLI